MELKPSYFLLIGWVAEAARAVFLALTINVLALISMQVDEHFIKEQ